MFHLQQNFKHMQSDISQLGEEISVKMEQSFIRRRKHRGNQKANRLNRHLQRHKIPAKKQISA